MTQGCGAGPVRVARELGLEAAARAEHAAGTTAGIGARVQVTAGLGSWDGADAGIRYVVVFEVAASQGSLPLITLDAYGLRSTNYSATIVANTSTLVVAELPTLDSALKGQAVLRVNTHSLSSSSSFSASAAVAADGSILYSESSAHQSDDLPGGPGQLTEGAVFDKSTNSFVRVLEGLVSGEAYHVRVSAFNGFGEAYGNAAYATPSPLYGLENYGVRY